MPDFPRDHALGETKPTVSAGALRAARAIKEEWGVNDYSACCESYPHAYSEVSDEEIAELIDSQIGLSAQWVDASRFNPEHHMPVLARISKHDRPVVVAQMNERGSWHTIPGGWDIKPTHWMNLPSELEN